MERSDRTGGDRQREPFTDAPVKGVFRDRESVSRAVRRLTAASVPVDSIRVFVVARDGGRRREISVEDEAGALRGALIGAGIGAAIGLALALLVTTGLFGSRSAGFFGISSISDALGVIAVCAIAGVPLGTILGMGRWDATKRISDAELTDGEVQVVVESAKLAKLARGVLEDAGADRVE
ncbi:MAG TPA: hypothetical protein VM198_02885 [Longimicrobiales bacterium]|nr:hypothetical protein [Longimicrobiales bacterium]